MTIKKVTEDLNALSFNTAVSQMMIFVNHALSLEHYNGDLLKKFLIILNPFAPHISEEIFELLNFNINGPISDQSWPQYEEKYLLVNTMNIAVQINGKTRGIMELDVGSNKGTIIKKILSNDNFQKYFVNGNIIKEIYVPNRLVNFVIKYYE